MKKIKIAFFGTPEFAGNILSGILEYSEIDISLVVSQPDKPVGRKRVLEPTPVKTVALDNKIVVIQPEKIKKNIEFHEYLKSLELDFIVVVAYGKIIPKAILDIPKYGCVNIHGSILPMYRGASPVQAALKDGQRETGLTIMCMSEGMDEGDILKVEKVGLDIVDKSPDVFEKFIEIGPDALVGTLKEIVSGDLKGAPQDSSKATYCGKISRKDGEISFEKQGSQEIFNTYRAYTPWPGIYTWYEGKRLVLEALTQFSPKGRDEATENQSELQSSSHVGRGDSEVRAGQFIKISKNKYGIICADKKILEIHRVKLEGKRSMDIVSFENGNREIVGYRFK